MITVGIINPPEGAVSWYPIFYFNGEIEPTRGERLPIWQRVGIKDVGDTINVGDMELYVYDNEDNRIAHFITDILEWQDGVAYLYDAETGLVETEGKAKGLPWTWIILGAGLVAAMVVVRQRK